MSAYSNEYSNFPQKEITLPTFKNVDNTVGEIVSKINALRNQGLFAEAAAVIRNSTEDLTHYIIDASTINTLIEEIYNTQIYARQKQQFIYFGETEPDTVVAEDVWIDDIIEEETTIAL